MKLSDAIVTQRLDEVMTRPLLKGNHTPDGEMCVMEAVAYIAGEPWSDAPRCVCPTLRDFAMAWNDGLRTDEERTRLLRPLVPLLVGTNQGNALALRRSYRIFDWLVRVYLPAWLSLTPSLAAHAAPLRVLAPLDSRDRVADALDTIAAAEAATRTVARAAAWVAVEAAAEAAAWVATRAATRAAAGAAVEAAAEPTVRELQDSAQALLREMCEMT